MKAEKKNSSFKIMVFRGGRSHKFISSCPLEKPIFPLFKQAFITTYYDSKNILHASIHSLQISAQ